MNRFRKQQGSLTVEASIVLPIFISVIVSIAFFIKVIHVQEVIQHAISGAANEMADLSYLLQVSGIKIIDDDINKGLSKGSENFHEKLNNVTEGVDAIASLFGNNVSQTKVDDRIFDPGNIDNIKKMASDIKQEIQDTKQKVDHAVNVIKDSANNPVDTFKSFVFAVAEEGYNDLKSEPFKKAVKEFTLKHFETGTVQDANQRLMNLNVVGGFEGLDFSQSKFFYSGSQDIEIVVRYRMKLALPFNVLPDIYMIQRATARAWLDGDGGQDTEEKANSIWEIRNASLRGRRIQQMDPYKRNLPKNFPVIAIFKNGVATKVRSINLKDATYQKPGNVKSEIKEDINKLIAFKGKQWAGTVITESQIKEKRLIVIFPKGQVNPEIREVLKECKKYARENKITLIINEL